MPRPTEERSSTEVPRHAYRPPFFPVLMVFFVLATLCAALATYALAEMGFEMPGVLSYAFLELVCLFYVWALVCAGVAIWYMTVRLSGDGIEGRTFWGNKRKIGWYNVSDARPIRPGFGRFLRVYSAAGGPPIWMPLFVKRRKALYAELVAYAGPEHPIAKCLVHRG